mmetsp:Transcript_2928/g.5402  ORF Transcript_2928/g.5402 Transcript_2928/m.5402 type:complete len:88 (-) Transcript_2928:86-349(-)|eukprot:CAMPEP_0202814666 /NCGR_PEP_ID=MMETSP1389-20130828/5739_1 /ASSEMBLY_ACC=CAM_ASM_000865 /TAXON_ID=302021 /ORGANISM="Rhodomonas sp., Strain CCMP768" /LENGTH=87 /DNA_ID=CAMNT_0049486477 /DNA_START=571 /DNA_END=834 /DNA_ORIENTATION=-
MDEDVLCVVAGLVGKITVPEDEQDVEQAVQRVGDLRKTGLCVQIAPGSYHLPSPISFAKAFRLSGARCSCGWKKEGEWSLSLETARA